MQAIDTTIHEIAHNWDSSKERSNRGVAANTWTQFQNISSWRTTSSSSHKQSGDGDWYFSKASDNGFFGSLASTDSGSLMTYGKWNPREDFATTFEEWFRIVRAQGKNGVGDGLSAIHSNSFKISKINAVSNFVSALS
jgi:hypothetical protein